MAEPVGEGQDLPRHRGRRKEEVLCAQHVPLPVGGGTPCGSPPGLHSQRHLRALQASERLQRAQPHGLRRLRTPCRAVCHTDRTAPRGDNRCQHSTLSPAARQHRLLLRLGPRDTHLRPQVLPLDTVGVREDVPVVLLQLMPEGTAHRKTREALRTERHRGTRRG